jgi:hypothetical protein
MPAPTISGNVPVIPRTRQAKKGLSVQNARAWSPAIGRPRRPVRIADATDAITDASYLATIMKASELAMHLFMRRPSSRKFALLK